MWGLGHIELPNTIGNLTKCYFYIYSQMSKFLDIICVKQQHIIFCSLYDLGRILENFMWICIDLTPSNNLYPLHYWRHYVNSVKETIRLLIKERISVGGWGVLACLACFSRSILYYFFKFAQNFLAKHCCSACYFFLSWSEPC